MNEILSYNDIIVTIDYTHYNIINKCNILCIVSMLLNRFRAELATKT